MREKKSARTHTTVAYGHTHKISLALVVERLMLLLACCVLQVNSYMIFTRRCCVYLHNTIISSRQSKSSIGAFLIIAQMR
jgi:hypothetical protein